MSTLLTTNLKNASSASNNIVLDASGNVAIQAGAASTPALYITGDSNTGLWSPTADTLAASTGGSERLRVDSSGRVLVGTTSASTFLSGASANLQVQSTASTFGLGVERATADSAHAYMVFRKTRSSSPNGNTIVNSGDGVGVIQFCATDGTGPIPAAYIAAEVDGTPGANDMPGRLVFSTTADSASSPVEHLRITQGGGVKLSQDGTYQSATTTRHELRTSLNTDVVLMTATSGTYANNMIFASPDRAASTAYNFFACQSGGFADTEFLMRGDGNGFLDGSWSSPAADYAEMFEWVDGNPNNEDRRGLSVVLDGEKIRPAEFNEEPIGIISANPTIVGDAAWDRWKGKYLTDDYGAYVWEDYEVEDKDGNTVVQQRRKLNPAYDPDQEYVSREQRPEWDCVGLMGKLRIRKGQPTGSRWIKMRDISDSVAEWLVR